MIEKLLKEFKKILDQVGYNISAAKYDHLTIPHPPRSTLQKKTNKSWNILKASVMESGNSEQITLSALMNQNKSLTEKVDKLQNFTQTLIETCAIEAKKINIKSANIPKTEVAKENLEFHSLVSDIHVGEYIDQTWVQGLNRYDVETYKKRSDQWLNKIVTFREQDKKSLGLNTLVIYKLGDIVTGEDIYKGQAFGINQNLVQQLFTALEVESSKILTLAEIFPKIIIYCVLGNHGRLNKASHHPKTNFDYIFYKVLQILLRSQKNVEIYVSESPSMLLQRGDFKILLNHGDNARGWMGIPYYGLDRQFRKLSGLYNIVVDYEFVGHHHTPASLGGYILINGSYLGGTDLSINRMNLMSLPSQKIFYFHHKFGINRKTDLILEKMPELTANNGIYTPNNIDTIGGDV